MRIRALFGRLQGRYRIQSWHRQERNLLRRTQELHPRRIRLIPLKLLGTIQTRSHSLEWLFYANNP